MTSKNILDKIDVIGLIKREKIRENQLFVLIVKD
jgi:hypothetical protein